MMLPQPSSRRAYTKGGVSAYLMRESNWVVPTVIRAVPVLTREVVYCMNSYIQFYKTMDEEISQSRFIELVGKEIGEFPAPLKTLQEAYNRLSKAHPQMATPELRQQIVDVNRKAIEEKFVMMMQGVFQAIEPELAAYKKHQSINYLDQTIRKKLDPAIYHKGYRLHKLEETPMAQLLEDREVDLANKFFTEMFDVMNELMLTMKIYYGYQDDEQISEALYASIATFAENNENSFMVEADNRLSVIEEERQSKIRNSGDGHAPYEVLVDVLDAVSKDQEKMKEADSSLLGKASNLVGVFYKYAIAPSVATTYSKIKQINPFAMNKSLTSEEEEALKLSLIEHLRPNLSLHEPMDEALVTLLIKILPMNSRDIIMTMSQDEKDKFTNLITDVLSTFEKPSGEFTEIVKEIMNVLETTMEMDVSQSENRFEEVMEAKWLILFYKAFEQSYSPERRRVLFEICKQPCIKEKLLNPFAIVKMIESEKESESPLLEKLRTLPVTAKMAGKKANRLSSDKTHDINLDMEHELNRIRLYELKKKYDKNPLIEFEKLTPYSNKRTITILFSGFMSEDTCKASEWAGFLDTVYDSEVYSVRWESKTYGSLLDFAVGGAKDIVGANLKIGILGSIGGPYLRAVAVMHELYKKYKSNPFNPAFDSAVKTGEFIAELLMANFKGHFINVVGFSLGTELIKNMLLRMEHRKCLHMINKVYFMGGVADKGEIEKLLQTTKASLNIVNLHSDCDSALKYLLKICKPAINPIGVYPIEEVPGHLIVNQDCSSVVGGHLAYRDNMKLLAKLLNMKDD